MTDLLQRFRDCTDPEQRELFTQTADQLSTRPEQIEKDLWLCVFLDRVFHRSGALHPSTVFKGATSLTKTYDIIKRFSEDIDLAIHPAAFGFAGDADPTDPANAFTPNTRRELRLALRDSLRAFVNAELAPALQARLPHGCSLTPQSQRGRTSHLEVRYPSLYPDNPLHTVVRIDFTATSLVAPRAYCEASPYVSRLFGGTWHIAPVPTLSPHQTFWEKVLALHDARSRFLQRARLPRLRGRHLSRHYYDVAMISAHPISDPVLDHPETLLRVRDHAQANSWKDYSSAEPGTLARPPHLPYQPKTHGVLAVIADPLARARRLRRTFPSRKSRCFQAHTHRCREIWATFKGQHPQNAREHTPSTGEIRHEARPLPDPITPLS